MIRGSFPENDLQLKAPYGSSPSCTPFADDFRCLNESTPQNLLQKRPVVSGSFAENDLQPKATYGSSPSCTPFADDFE